MGQYREGDFHAEQISHNKANAEVDDELQRLIAGHKTRIKVIGCGGAGNNTINRISEIGIKGIETIAMNTDAQDLLYTNAHTKILIGKEITKGLGAGSIPQVGEEAARESEHDIRQKLQGADMVLSRLASVGGQELEVLLLWQRLQKSLEP